ncbi:MAG: SiaB family protein kinase [Bacteroidales bacterium]|nr:SiaB family protein kinase [Bacteroidales bacterium]
MSDNTNHILFQTLAGDDLSFLYLGKFENSILGFATEILKSHMTLSDDSEGKKNKLSFLMIESFQNILRYGLSGRAEDVTSGEVFAVRKYNGSYYITTGNYVENVHIELVREKLNRVNTLSPEELKRLFIETLQNKKLSKQGGAGLGFMEMVRKTKEKIDFDFVEIDADRSFFYFQLRLKDDPADTSDPLPIQSTKDLKRIMEQNGRYIAMKGDFTQTAINPILSMAENNFGEENLKTQRQVYHILVEMLQNIAKHAKVSEKGRHEGLFSMGVLGGDYIVSASNGIEDAKAQKIGQYIEKLNAMTRQQLDDYYRKVLRGGHEDVTILSGLGLIDIARESKSKIGYSINDIAAHSKILSMTATL